MRRLQDSEVRSFGPPETFVEFGFKFMFGPNLGPIPMSITAFRATIAGGPKGRTFFDDFMGFFDPFG